MPFTITAPTPAGPNPITSAGTVNVTGANQTPSNPINFTIFEYHAAIGPFIGSAPVNVPVGNFATPVLAWGSLSLSASGANKFLSGCDSTGFKSMFPFHVDPPSGYKLILESKLYPAGLNLLVDSHFEGGNKTAREALNQPALLFYSQDPQFTGNWYSPPIEFGGDQAFWQLKMVATNHRSKGHTWLLSLQFLSGETGTYLVKTKDPKKEPFPIKLKLKSQPAGPFTTWPKSITLSFAQ